jgi:hypothetical protein
VQRLEILRVVDRHDPLTPQAIDQQVAGGYKQETLRVLRQAFRRPLVDAHVDFLAQIGHVGRARRHPAQVTHQPRLAGQDLGREPMVQGALHAACENTPE